MSWRKEARRSVRYVLLRAAIVANRTCPRSVALRVSGGLGGFSRHILPRTWRRTVAHLAASYPELSECERERLARSVFREMGKNASDALGLASARGAEILRSVSTEGWPHFVEAYRARRGVLVLTGHIGCWELLGAYLCHRGYPLSVLARPLREARLDRLVRAMRARYGAAALDARRSLRAAAAALRHGGVVGVLLDLNTGDAGVPVAFFGRPAWTPLTAAWLARRTGAAVVPMAIGRLPDGGHRVRVRPALALGAGGDSRNDVERDTAACAAAVEELIRHDPSQWVWFHPRWKARRTRDPASGPVAESPPSGRRRVGGGVRA
jgi:KDO2-lipid IV(A) lauroyltransferase